jgi:hypothetical protein
MPRSIWLTIAWLRPVISESLARVMPFSLRMARTLLPTVASSALVAGGAPFVVSVVIGDSFTG